MHSTGHTIHCWRSAILSGGRHADLISQSPSPEAPKEPADVDEPRRLHLEPTLDLSTMTIVGTWKDLPQEIVDYIVLMLRNDLNSLKACSLTCKAMFISTRRLIHSKICLSWEQNWEVLTLREKQRYIRGDRQGIAVKVLSGIAAHGLLPYGRRLFINLNRNFTPANLQPFNNHFQRFDQIQELRIYWLHTQGFLEQFGTFFANFVPTVRSLHLDTPTGATRDILDFICRFPHLDDLTFRMSSDDPHDWRTWKSASLPIVKKMPPFRGRLKLHGIGDWRGYILQQLVSLPGKRCFRFIDFSNCTSEAEQPIIDGCSNTIETLSTSWKKFREYLFAPLHSRRSEEAVDEKGLPLNLIDVTNLRSLTLRVDFEAIRYPYEVLSQTLRTITSSSFSEFVLEVEYIFKTLEPANSAWKWWGTWTELDKIFEGIDVERGFRMVIRAKNVDDDSHFIAQARNRLPLIHARGKLVFEIGPFPKR